ncbi:hypothetical protein CARUB_v10016051mg [Capsella rubella]|uniref:Phorbol-ester/DAG-type domain-containing protein n=1 Tax=Capsella rubella TaxID=81985 RepID=R0GAY8_9BRAS|nr:uncharacterized protein LOC17893224 [Capsella rubella]EOA32746.1 hypothetical protein CARUB_v10016051mg [Capsella rubella]
MDKVEVPIHKHPLLPFARFIERPCEGCRIFGYIYKGYRCNELGCHNILFHKECAESLPEINHPSHPDHPLKLLLKGRSCTCSQCGVSFQYGYICSICDFMLDLSCAGGQAPLLVLEKSNLHEHPLDLFNGLKSGEISCKACQYRVYDREQCYRCYQCELVFHLECANFFPEASHPSHPQHQLKCLTAKAAPDYADKKCLLCGIMLRNLHHCDVCNFSICSRCMSNPPPLVVASLTTHEHQLHLVPRCINFTCNACGTQGDRSPYFCLQCNFMIHRECIDLPRVININRHDHRITYTHRFGHGNWKCRVCRKRVDEFYGGYSCSKCSDYVVHSRCATRRDVWDMIELEGTPEEPEEVAPFEVIDDNTIKHFSHEHNLQISNYGSNHLEELKLCQACVFQICTEPFYSCKQCGFCLHQKCAKNHRKKRHMCHYQPFTLDTNSECKQFTCQLCFQRFNGFRYKSLNNMTLDVRCGSSSEPLWHESHPHPLYYSKDNSKHCSECGKRGWFSCDECNFSLDFKCALLPNKVMRHRYDDHPLVLSYGESSSVDGKYWCEACETQVDPKKWFYTCNDCGVILHISCVEGDFTYIKPNSVIPYEAEYVSNTSTCRPVCTVCNTRCKLSTILKYSGKGKIVYVCSFKCLGIVRFRVF